jgi:hypothetical protein
MEGNAQHGKERAHHHKSLQRGLFERRGPRAMLHTQKGHATQTGGLPPIRNRTHTPNSPGQHTSEHNVSSGETEELDFLLSLYLHHPFKGGAGQGGVGWGGHGWGGVGWEGWARVGWGGPGWWWWWWGEVGHEPSERCSTQAQAP